MNKKIIKAVFLIFIIFSILTILTGCETSVTMKEENNKEKEENEIIEYNGYVLEWQNYGRWYEDIDKVIIPNTDELQKFCDKLENEDESFVVVDRICRSIELFKKYDDEYFKTKSLAIVGIELVNGTQSINFKNAIKEGDNVKINYEIDTSNEIGTDDIRKGFIVVEINKDINDIIINEEYSFFGKVVESNVSHIIVEPNENEEIRKSSNKISIELGEDNDAIYKVGTNVKITYDGNIMESYPAQVKATKIELKSADKFSLVFYQKNMVTPKQIETIISEGEIENVNYNVYAFEGNVAINLNSDSSDLTESSIPLREALLQNKITMNEIIQKANRDFPDAEWVNDYGEIMEYRYENYTIIRNRDVYIGGKNMTIRDLGI